MTPAEALRLIQDDDGRDDPPTCPYCEGTGMRETRKPIPGLVYCHCETGKEARKRKKERDDREREAIDHADLWNRPDEWPW